MSDGKLEIVRKFLQHGWSNMWPEGVERQSKWRQQCYSECIYIYGEIGIHIWASTWLIILLIMVAVVHQQQRWEQANECGWVSFVGMHEFVCMENERDNASIEIRINMYIQVDVTYTIYCRNFPAPCIPVFPMFLHFSQHRICTEFAQNFTRILMTNMLTQCNSHTIPH